MEHIVVFETTLTCLSWLESTLMACSSQAAFIVNMPKGKNKNSQINLLKKVKCTIFVSDACALNLIKTILEGLTRQSNA